MIAVTVSCTFRMAKPTTSTMMMSQTTFLKSHTAFPSWAGRFLGLESQDSRSDGPRARHPLRRQPDRLHESKRKPEGLRSAPRVRPDRFRSTRRHGVVL